MAANAPDKFSGQQIHSFVYLGASCVTTLQRMIWSCGELRQSKAHPPSISIAELGTKFGCVHLALKLRPTVTNGAKLCIARHKEIMGCLLAGTRPY